MGVSLKVNESRYGIQFTVDLALPEKGISVLFGASGAGKTTLLRALAGLEQFENAAVSFRDQVWQDGDVFLPPHQRRVGYVFQEASLFSHLSVQQNIDYARRRAKRSLSELNDILRVLGINNIANRSVNTLSGGERQRVAIARALAANPQLLLMDEPMASLDRRTANEILPFIEQLSDRLDIPIVYVSHSIDEVARIGQTIALLKRGQLLGSGDMVSMLTRLDLPLARHSSAEALIVATVDGYDAHTHSNQLKFSAGEFITVGHPLRIGTEVKVRVAARDVSITLTAQKNTSILNIFAARIIEMQDDDNGLLLVKLKVGDDILLSRITQYSARNLALVINQLVYAQIKSVAVLA